MLLGGLFCPLLPPNIATAQDCIGPGDTNIDGQVLLDDYASFQGCIAGPGFGPEVPACEPNASNTSDLDADGDVDLLDAAGFQRAFGNEYFLYGPHLDDWEVEVLAIELSNEIRAPIDLYERIHRDLALIRTVAPQLNEIHYRRRYAARELIYRPEGMEPRPELTRLKAYYIAVEDRQIRRESEVRLLTFCDTMDMLRVAQVFRAHAEVVYAEPNFYIGDGNEIDLTIMGDDYQYAFRCGYGDCLAGCYCDRTWTVTVSFTGQLGAITCVDLCTGTCDVPTLYPCGY